MLFWLMFPVSMWKVKPGLFNCYIILYEARAPQWKCCCLFELIVCTSAGSVWANLSAVAKNAPKRWAWSIISNWGCFTLGCHFWGWRTLGKNITRLQLQEKSILHLVLVSICDILRYLAILNMKSIQNPPGPLWTTAAGHTEVTNLEALCEQQAEENQSLRCDGYLKPWPLQMVLWPKGFMILCREGTIYHIYPASMTVSVDLRNKKVKPSYSPLLRNLEKCMMFQLQHRSIRITPGPTPVPHPVPVPAPTECEAPPPKWSETSVAWNKWICNRTLMETNQAFSHKDRWQMFDYVETLDSRWF